MKDETKILDSSLEKSKRIKTFCDDRIKLINDFFELDYDTDFKIHWLESIEIELDKVIQSIKKVETQRNTYILGMKNTK